MLKKAFIPVLGILTVIIVLGGCAGNADSDAAVNSVLYGQITAIDGSSVTIATGTQPERADNPPQQGAANEDSQAVPNRPQGDAPSGDWPRSDGNAQGPPTGNWSRGDGNAPGMTFTGEEQTITVTDSAVITVRSGNGNEMGSVDDLKSGDIITVQFDDSGTVQSIAVMRMTGGFPEQDGSSDNQNAEITNSDVSKA